MLKRAGRGLESGMAGRDADGKMGGFKKTPENF